MKNETNDDIALIIENKGTMF